MKLTWRDTISTILVICGGAVVYAKYYNYSWAVISSWRSATLVLAGIAVLMFLVNNFNFANRSLLNIAEMFLGIAAIVLAVYGALVISHTVFYALAAVMGAFWLIDTARHARHSMHSEGGTNTLRHVHVS